MTKNTTQLDPLAVIAKRRIDTLLSLAKEEVRTDEKLAKRYVHLARSIASRHRIPLGRERKHLFCKKCDLPWIVGKNVKVRLEQKTRRAIYTCACGEKKGFAYTTRKPSKSTP